MNLNELTNIGLIISEPIRLRILCLLYQGYQINNRTFSEVLGVIEANTQRHLKYIRDHMLLDQHLFTLEQFDQMNKEGGKPYRLKVHDPLMRSIIEQASASEQARTDLKKYQALAKSEWVIK